MISVLVQQCSSTSIPAARMIRAAVLNSCFECSSDVCVEFEGVMEISEKNKKQKIQQYEVPLDAAGCGVLACTSRLHDKSLQLLYYRELLLIKLVAWRLASLFSEVTPLARTLNERCVGLKFWSVYHDDHT